MGQSAVHDSFAPVAHFLGAIDTELRQTLGFDREKTRCVATLHYLFRRLDVDAFEGALSRWAKKALREGDQAIALDGKALRGIHGEEIPGVRLVAAYAHESGLVLAQKGG